MMNVRQQFDEDLKRLNEKTVLMGALCLEAFDKVIRMMKNGFNEKILKEIDEAEKASDHAEKELEAMCVRLLFRQQPFAKDLRFISAVLKMITDFERVADQLLDIALLIRENDGIDPTLINMASASYHMYEEALKSFVSKDPNLAQKVTKEDNEIDELFAKVKQETVKAIKEDRDGLYMVDRLMIGKYLERLADHSTNIAEWVEYAMFYKEQ